MNDPAHSAAGVTGSPEMLAALWELWQDTDVWITLKGRSMTPAIRPGSRLRLRWDRELLVPGAIIAYRRGEHLVVHRLIKCSQPADGSEPELECRGDRNNYCDDPFSLKQVVGVVVEVKPPPFAESVQQVVRSLARRCRLAAAARHSRSSFSKRD